MSKRSELNTLDELYADARVALGIAHGSRLALERPGECNQRTIAPALHYVEVALERIIDNVAALDAMRTKRNATGKVARPG